MKTAYFDCFNGASGDMILGALVQAGADADALVRGLESLELEFSLSFEKTVRGGITAVKAEVHTHEHHPHRGLSDIKQIIGGSGLSARVKQQVISIFERLAKAEATVHGCSLEEIHFHEVGAIDAIVDITGACLALELLGIERIVSSPLPLGSGTVRCAHGLLPVPAPAVAELVKGFPVYDNGEPGERVTPTGAAILTTLSESFGPLPGLTVEAAGYGSGTRPDQKLPNLLRVLVGENRENREVGEVGEVGEVEEKNVVLVETNLDDCNPQFLERAMERLFEAGALDVAFHPVGMKKNRPGVMLSAVVPPSCQEACAQIVLEETTALGVRLIPAERRVMSRKIEAVETPYGPVRVKVASREKARNRMPEYEDCLRAAREHGVPVKEVWMKALVPPSQPENGSSGSMEGCDR